MTNLFPFVHDGSLVGYLSQHDVKRTWHNGEIVDVVWKEAFVMEGPLAIQSFERGRSAAVVILANAAGAIFPVTAADFVAALQKFPVQGGCILGAWTMKKRGANYRLVPVYKELDQ